MSPPLPWSRVEGRNLNHGARSREAGFVISGKPASGTGQPEGLSSAISGALGTMGNKASLECVILKQGGGKRCGLTGWYTLTRLCAT
jgi:hypothetical protein